ncbi:sensor histidine kinase [Nocardioides piscis]|uniref:Uncharacterized protein n=1 Tax=Nocardioides piscis TaxID=2714938 RepID=A0A6G7YJI6_9ACTN|nr:histidine kinase [Nocardioides piscis]QIK76886.1 hypothetical protein G7071_17045 [Nocardioides piscis]
MPAAVAGVRFGVLPATNATFVAAIAIITSLLVSSAADDIELLSRAVVWLLVGYGVGMLASWQLRSVRDIEARQAPYAAANQLMSQLHHLAQRGRVGLDSVQLAVELEANLRRRTGAEQVGVFTIGPTGQSELLACHGDRLALGAFHDQIRQNGTRPPELAELVLRGADGLRGRVLLIRDKGWSDEDLAVGQEITDEYVLRLDTAVLFDDVRLMATAEERNRIAREMHDGVAQEIVALGYVVDEIETVSEEPEIRALAASLRDEISRVVTELRFSIFDLRHQVTEHRLPAALTEYARELSHGSELRVHLVLDESGQSLPMWMESELLRIAQEAIGNVRKHAQAENLWVTLQSDGVDVKLRIEDDGIGNATPKERHWGLQTMTERAERIGACLTIGSRPGGGTIVSLSNTGSLPLEKDRHT